MFQLFHRLRTAFDHSSGPTRTSCSLLLCRKRDGFLPGEIGVLSFLYNSFYLQTTWQASRVQETSFNQREIPPFKGSLCINYHAREGILQREPRQGRRRERFSICATSCPRCSPELPHRNLLYLSLLTIH